MGESCNRWVGQEVLAPNASQSTMAPSIPRVWELQGCQPCPSLTDPPCGSALPPGLAWTPAAGPDCNPAGPFSPPPLTQLRTTQLRQDLCTYVYATPVRTLVSVTLALARMPEVTLVQDTTAQVVLHTNRVSAGLVVHRVGLKVALPSDDCWASHTARVPPVGGSAWKARESHRGPWAVVCAGLHGEPWVTVPGRKLRLRS